MSRIVIFFRVMIILLASMVVALSGLTPAQAAYRQPSLSVTITSPGSGATFVPGSQVTVSASSNIVRVEYSIVSTSYMGLTESYLGSATRAPFRFTWNGYASAVSLGGGSYRLMARAYNSREAMVTNEVVVNVPGTFNGPAPSANNTAASPYYQATLFNGAAWISHSLNSAVRPLVQFNAASEAAEFSVSAPVAGLYEITIPQYILTGAKPQLEARVNGVLASILPAVQTVTNTNDFGREGTSTFVAELVQGANTIRLTSLGNGVVSINGVRIAQP